MSDSVFSDRLNQVINDLHIPSTTLPIVLTYNTLLIPAQLEQPLHSWLPWSHALSTEMATSRFRPSSSQLDRPEHFSAGRADVSPLSHEISEWMNDPFIHNLVPPRQFPSSGSCQAISKRRSRRSASKP
jgi:hypothetical protein